MLRENLTDWYEDQFKFLYLVIPQTGSEEEVAFNQQT
jgi:hypothetical protein